MAEKEVKKRIRRGKKQIILDKVTKSFSALPQNIAAPFFDKIEKALDGLEAAAKDYKKSQKKISVKRITKGKTPEEIKALICALENSLKDK